MRVLRASVTAAIIAMLTCAGLVATTAPAWAAEPKCGQSFICLDDLRDFSGYGDVLSGYQAASAWLSNLGGLVPTAEEQCEEYRRTLDPQDPDYPISCQYAEAYLPYAPGGLTQTKSLGTALEVKNGTAMKSFLCGGGSGCQKLLSGAGLLRGGEGGTEDVLSDGQDPKTGLQTAAFGPGKYYPATSVSAGPWATIADIYKGTPGSAREGEIGLDSADGVCFTLTGLQPGSRNGYITYRSSVYNVVSREWFHFGQPILMNFLPTGATACIDPTGSSRSGPDWQLRSFAIVADRPIVPGSMANESDTGFTWGQDFLPAGSNSRSTVRCQRSNGTEYDVVGELSPVDRHQVLTPSCVAGDKPLWNQLDVVAPDGTVIPQTIVNLRPGWDPTTLPADKDPFPQCANGSCIWIIKVGDTWCARGVQGCTDWADRPQEAKCYLGPYELPLTRCGHLERLYETGPDAIPATQPNRDGDPDTREGPGRTTTPNPDASPAPGPTTNPNPNPSTNPTPNPSGSPTPNPSSTPSTPTTPCTTPGCNAPPTQSESADCFPSGWSAFNPVQWVLKPIKCAFIPSETLTRTRLGTVKTTLEAHGPGPLITQVGDVIDAVPQGGGCLGPAIDFDLGGQDFTIHPVAACEAPMSTVASYSKALTGVVIGVTGLLSVVRAVSSAFGLNFSMGKGASDGD